MKNDINRKTELIQIRVTEDQKENIRKLSRKKGLSISEYVMNCILRQISEDEILKLVSSETEAF